MSWNDPSIVQWWLPAGYVAIAAFVDALWRGRNATPSRRKQTARGEDGDSIRAPLLQGEDAGELLIIASSRCSTVLQEVFVGEAKS